MVGIASDIRHTVSLEIIQDTKIKAKYIYMGLNVWQSKEHKVNPAKENYYYL